MDSARSLSLVLRANAFYDWAALALLLSMPAALFDVFGHPWPAEPFLFRLAALPLWMAPVVYWMAANDPVGRPAMVRASIGLRLVGAAGIAALLVWHRPAGQGAYWSFVVLDLVWAAAIVLARRPVVTR